MYENPSLSRNLEEKGNLHGIHAGGGADFIQFRGFFPDGPAFFSSCGVLLKKQPLYFAAPGGTIKEKSPAPEAETEV